MQERLGLLVDDPVVDAIGAAVLGDAHLVVGTDVVDARPGRHERLAACFVDVDKVPAIVGAQHIGHDEDRRGRRHQHWPALCGEALEILKRLDDLRRNPRKPAKGSREPMLIWDRGDYVFSTTRGKTP